MTPRVVADTNVLVSHFVLPGRNPSKLLAFALAGKLRLLTCEFILEELEGVLREKIGFPAKKARAARDTVSGLAEVIQPRHVVDEVREDESDNRVLECALSGNADAVVTGDKKHLLPLKAYRGIPILSPGDFLKKATADPRSS